MIAANQLSDQMRSRTLTEFIEAASCPDRPWTIPFPLGEDADEELRFADLADGHILIAGSTGSGKTRFVQALIASISRTCDPGDVCLLIIDGKGLDLATVFRDLPHNLCGPITEIDEAIGAVNWVAHEMDRRRRILRDDGTPHIWAYRAAREAHGLAPDLPALCVVIDEVQALTQTSADAMRNLTRLSQQGRASGILLVLATQRPTRNVIDPAIKANLPCRICFRVPSQVDSRVALDRHGAERLRHPGELFAVHPTMNEAVRLTAPFVSDDDLFEMIERLQLPRRTVAALPPADEPGSLSASVVSEDEQMCAVSPECNGTLDSGAATNGHIQLAGAPRQSPECDPKTPELATLSCFADVEFEASTIASHLGQEVESLGLVYRPTVVLEISRRWKRRQLLLDVLTGRLFVPAAPPGSIPFLDVFADLDVAEREILAIASSGSLIAFDEPREAAGWRLVVRGLLGAERRGFRINRDLRYPPSVRALAISMQPRNNAQMMTVSADLIRTREEEARREVAWVWRPGGMATSVAGLPYWRWHAAAGGPFDIPAWVARWRSSVAAVARSGLLSADDEYPLDPAHTE